MGWRLNILLIETEDEKIDSVIDSIQLCFPKRKLEFFDDTPLGECLDPSEDDVIFIGIINNVVIVADSQLPFNIIEKHTNELSESVLELSENGRKLYSFILDSTINLWGYSKIVDGENIRTKFGSMDTGIIKDYGEPLPSEIALINNSEIVNGDRIYNYKGKELAEHQMGDEFVFRLIGDIVKDRIDRNSKLIHTEMKMYEKVY